MKQYIVDRIEQQAPEVSALLAQGIPIEKMESSLSSLLFEGYFPVTICNENKAFYTSDEKFLYFYTLCSAQGGFGQELDGYAQCRETLEFTDASLKIYSMCDWLRRRLRIPKVLLVNLHYVEKYPSYRFALGIADIAGYLRKYGLANVTIADMQFVPKHEIKKLISSGRYDIIGLSTNFGHFPLMEELISDILDESADSRIVVGNYLAATEFQHILELYPDILVSSNEGELTFAALCSNYIEKEQSLDNVPNLYYCTNHEIHFTFHQLIDMDEIALPAFDTVEALFERGGVMTMEFSRGCNYGKCSFCPRKFKGQRWRGMSSAKMLQVWERCYQLFQLYQKTPYLYFADEEFLGNCKEDINFKRIDTFLQSALSKALPINFDVSFRLDQVADKARNPVWSRRQMALLDQAKRLGLKRIFVGLESGSDVQLRRYNKGFAMEQGFCALRILSRMGFTLRLGFITFDPLMTKDDLAQNLRTIMRRDILLTPKAITDIDLEAILKNESSTAANGEFLFTAISYPASPLEVLRDCEYAKDILKNYPQLAGKIEFSDNFGRLSCEYLDPDIQLICMLCQKWVNFHFPFIYVTKGFAKRGDENQYCYQKIIQLYRRFTCILLVCLCYNKGVISSTDYQQYTKALLPKGNMTLENHCTESGQTISFVEGVLKENIQYTIETLTQKGKSLPTELDDIYHGWITNSSLSEDSVRKN